MKFRYYATRRMQQLLLLLALVALSGATAEAQKRSKKAKTPPPVPDRVVMWEPVNIAERDLYLGPGGREWMPHLSRVKFIRKESGGANTKYRIEDANGRVWIAKLGVEARPETAAVRLLWGLGYKTEINYLAPVLTIPGKGTFRNVRLEARSKDIDRLGEWKWKRNPFLRTPELQGLKIMQIFMTNWDVLDKQNEILEVKVPGGVEHHYVISDLGRTFGKFGNNNLPIIYRLGRKTGSPSAFSKASFINGFEKGRIKFGIKGKSRKMLTDVSMEDAQWIYERLRQLSDRQIEDAFRAANYSPSEIATYRQAVKRRIAELEELTTGRQYAER